MKQIIRAMIIFLIGLICASIAAYIYFNMTSGTKEVSNLDPHNMTGQEEAFIKAISGEVYILRNDEIKTAEIGEPLYAGDIIKVVDDSFCQVQFSDLAAASIRSNTVIKIKNLFNLDKKADIKTEILTGSMLYRVNKLSEGEKLEVQSEERIFSVRGTTFFVDRNSEGTYLVVNEGAVAVSEKDSEEEALMAKAGNELFIEKNSENEILREISEKNKLILQEASNLNLLNLETDQIKLIKTSIITEPGDSQIYVNGILSGRGSYIGLFPESEEITFLIRKRGYEDKVLTIQAVSDLQYRIKLSPQLINDSVMESERIRSAEYNNIERYRKELESKTLRLEEIETLIVELKENNTRLESENITNRNDLRKLGNQLNELEETKEELIKEISQLNNNLSESTAREEKLRLLIKQIQDLSTSD